MTQKTDQEWIDSLKPKLKIRHEYKERFGQVYDILQSILDDWYKNAEVEIRSLLAEKEKEKEQAVIAVSNAKLGGLWDIAQADMVKKILAKIDAHQKSLRYENFKGRLDYELGLEKAIDIIKISNS